MGIDVDFPSFEDLGKGLSSIGDTIKEAGENVVKNVKTGGEAVKDFAKEHGRDIVDGMAKVAQGMEDTEGSWNPDANSHPDMGGGTHTEGDFE